jgi:hypothetical protein
MYERERTSQAHHNNVTTTDMGANTSAVTGAGKRHLPPGPYAVTCAGTVRPAISANANRAGVAARKSGGVRLLHEVASHQRTRSPLVARGGTRARAQAYDQCSGSVLMLEPKPGRPTDVDVAVVAFVMLIVAIIAAGLV